LGCGTRGGPYEEPSPAWEVGDRGERRGERIRGPTLAAQLELALAQGAEVERDSAVGPDVGEHVGVDVDAEPVGFEEAPCAVRLRLLE